MYSKRLRFNNSPSSSCVPTDLSEGHFVPSADVVCVADAPFEAALVCFSVFVTENQASKVQVNILKCTLLRKYENVYQL